MTSKAASESRLVTFIRPPLVSTEKALSSNDPTPSIGIAYLSGHLRARGYRTAVVDSIAEGLDRIWPLPANAGFIARGLPLEEIVERIPSDTDLMAFSIIFSGDWPLARDLINLVKERFPDIPTIAGGEHITALAEYNLRDAKGLDYCVIGEGEGPLHEFCENLFTKGNGKGTRGVVFLDENAKFVSCDEIPRIRDVGQIPWPDWDNTPLAPFWNYGFGHGPSSTDVRGMPLLASRGCPYRCTFCSSPQMWTTRYITRDVDDTLDEIEHYVERFNVGLLQFYDLTAITLKKWIVDFCTKYMERGLNVSWTLPSGTRSEVLDDETLGLLAQTNCTYLCYAPESGCEETLRIIKKQITLSRITESMRTAKGKGISVRANLIIGFPHETRKQIWESVLYGLKLISLGIDESTLHLFSPYPGSEIFNQLVEEGTVQVNNDYLYRLSTINGDLLSLNQITYCKHVGSVELTLIRIFFYIAQFSLAYLLFPHRILRFMRGLFGMDSTNTFERKLIRLFRARFSWLRKLTVRSEPAP